MRTRACFPAVLLFAVLLCPPAPAQTTAASVLAAMKTASGGAAWDRVTTLHVVSAVKGGGLMGTEEEWDDTRTGRYSVSSVLGPAAEQEGYDGTRAWSRDASGQARVVAAADDVAAAYSAAYRDCFAYWFPSRRAGGTTYLRHAQEKGRGFDVVQIAPHGGLPFQFWVDDHTHLLDRIVQSGAQETNTTFVSGYRAVSGLLLPFGLRETTGDTRYDTLGRACSRLGSIHPPPRRYLRFLRRPRRTLRLPVMRLLSPCHFSTRVTTFSSAFRLTDKGRFKLFSIPAACMWRRPHSPAELG